MDVDSNHERKRSGDCNVHTFDGWLYKHGLLDIDIDLRELLSKQGMRTLDELFECNPTNKELYIDVGITDESIRNTLLKALEAECVH